MDFENDGRILTDIPAPPGLSFWPKVVGRLTSFTGTHHLLGNYTCPHIITKGRGWVKTATHCREMHPGDMFSLMNEGQIEYYDDPDDPWIFYYLHIGGSADDALVKSWGFTPEAPWLHPEEPERVIECFKNIFSMACAPSPPRSNILAAELFKLSDAIHNPLPYKKSRSKQLVDRAQAIIASQLHTPLNVTELASALNVDRTTLFHAFHKEHNCSPIDYLREKRIERACSILKNSNRTIVDIAKMCGFSNDKYFIKTFKKLKGTSPRKYNEE